MFVSQRLSSSSSLLSLHTHHYYRRMSTMSTNILRINTHHTIDTIDCHYMNYENFAAAYLLVHHDTAIFIDNNTNNSVNTLMNALKRHGLDGTSVSHLIVTHIHLDHAGGTGLLAKQCPNAKVLAHPNAAPHLVDPTKIIRGAKHVYGEAEFNRLYGDILPVESDRVRSMNDGEELIVANDFKLAFYHTRGHAKHHMVIHDQVSNSVFTGDAFGISYLPVLRALQPRDNAYQPFLFPSSSPIDFELDEAHKSLDVIAKLAPDRCYPTHFGVWEDVQGGVTQMHSHLDTYGELLQTIEHRLKELQPVNEDAKEVVIQETLAHMTLFFQHQLELRGIEFQACAELLKSDIELNANGLVIAVVRKLKKSNPELFTSSS